MRLGRRRVIKGRRFGADGVRFVVPVEGYVSPGFGRAGKRKRANVVVEVGMYLNGSLRAEAHIEDAP
jgi:hypothetical protein